MSVKYKGIKEWANCPFAKVALIFSDKWTMLIIRDLLTGPKRFGDFEASLGISTRTLSTKLKSLEKNAIVVRDEFKGFPARIEYYLSDCGKELSEIAKAMKAYGEKYL